MQLSLITLVIYSIPIINTISNVARLLNLGKHNDLAIDAIDFNMKDDFRVKYETFKNFSNKMVCCQYFTTNYIHLDSEVQKKNTLDSFVIYICTEGFVKITTESNVESISKGETLLLPAAIKNYTLQSENAELLEVYV